MEQPNLLGGLLALLAFQLAGGAIAALPVLILSRWLETQRRQSPPPYPASRY